jgi:hypothetical protein
MSSALPPRTDIDLARPLELKRYADRRLWNFDRARFPLCAKAEDGKSTAIGALARIEHHDVYCSIALISQASVLRGKSISAHCSAAAISQDYGHCAPLLIQAWTNSPADS